ncbi:MAG TPA: asparagine synthase (glutamine-hydrolyzing) [Burkholderiales bacterium]|nr:asparagine synthase (glutamine-hydrolyzing) [Burkholderiales bacterium]HTT19192.1 asparagine synthase (glutamine-hydrolyzing) [Candidatus Sulfotelmatobacter sp.]
MCGVVGFITPKSLVAPSLITDMASALSHRGPDDSGYWLDESMGVALGHRRLSIVDLSPAGHQPMQSRSGRYVLAFNGEVYNFREIRKELESASSENAISWRGHSDTEVMLEAINIWGFQAALKKFAGMFAIALWDREERTLYLARDRLGEKPLYYGEIDGSFVFGSELKALRLFPGSGLEIDRRALALFMQFQYIPSPHSIYRGIHKLEPGAFLSVRATEAGAFALSSPRRYWAIDMTGRGGERIHIDEGSLVEELHALLQDSVKRQMVSDVPLGAFLSGGIDSSTIVALMQAQSSRPVRTFTIGFREESFNEAQHAKAVAQHLGTEHTEFYVTPEEAAAVIPRLPEIYDEPFADSSQIPTYLVSRLTRQYVTVSLSGDGGDELFAGYPRYVFSEILWNRIRWLPRWVRRGASKVLQGPSAKSWDRLLGRAIPSRLRSSVSGHRIHRLAEVLRCANFNDMYVRLVSLGAYADSIVLDVARESRANAVKNVEEDSYLNRMRRFDIEQYLPDDLLVKVDRASMSVALESRAPMLDHRLVEFAWKLPRHVLVRDGVGKWILRQVLDRYVPRKVVERPKAGFGIPIGQWLRSNLREWAEHLLAEETIRRHGVLDPGPVRRTWSEHLSGTHDRQVYLWSVLMLQAWLETRTTPN